MANLTLTHNNKKYKLDEFYKSLMFQYIMDMDSINKDERDILLLIFRKTIHFNKYSDRLGIYFISKSVGIGQVKTRKIIKQLEYLELIYVERSTGGRIKSEKKFHLFSLHDSTIETIFFAWLGVKGDKNFYVGDEEEF